MGIIENTDRLRYGQFVELLNTIRGSGLMSAELRREYDKRWRSYPEQRDFILEELERIMEAHSEQLIRERER